MKRKIRPSNNRVYDRKCIEMEPFEHFLNKAFSGHRSAQHIVTAVAGLKEHLSIFTKPGCPYCEEAKVLLLEKSYPFKEIVVGKDISSAELKVIVGKNSAPQIFSGGKYIGTKKDLVGFLKN